MESRLILIQMLKTMKNCKKNVKNVCNNKIKSLNLKKIVLFFFSSYPLFSSFPLIHNNLNLTSDNNQILITYQSDDRIS